MFPVGSLIFRSIMHIPADTKNTHGLKPTTAICINRLVKEHVHVSRAQIYRLMSRDAFPKPVKIGKSSLWLSDEVAAWIEARRAERDARPAPKANLSRLNAAAERDAAITGT
jgi:prophage regulatory protein